MNFCFLPIPYFLLGFPATEISTRISTNLKTLGQDKNSGFLSSLLAPWSNPLSPSTVGSVGSFEKVSIGINFDFPLRFAFCLISTVCLSFSDLSPYETLVLLVGHLHLLALALKLHESRTPFQPLHLEECLAHSRVPNKYLPVDGGQSKKALIFPLIFLYKIWSWAKWLN